MMSAPSMPILWAIMGQQQDEDPFVAVDDYWTGPLIFTDRGEAEAQAAMLRLRFTAEGYEYSVVQVKPR
jgi:hypothetical protein